MKRTDRKSRCAVNAALETVGDPWSLLVVRDIVFYGKHTFGEFLASEERITSSVLADRLHRLVQEGILAKDRDREDARKEFYSLTEKGLALIPILVELANWGFTYGPDIRVNTVLLDQVQADRVGLYQLIHDTVSAGGSVFSGHDSVISRDEASDRPGAHRLSVASGEHG